MDFHQLECFVTIAETGTVSKAAEILMFSQPALTRTLKSLEEEIGYALFERSKNHLVLNDYGKIAIKFAKDILNTKQKMTDNLDSYHKSKQRISIGSCAPAPLWGIKQLLNSRYSEIPIDSQMTENEDELIDNLKNHVFSLIILTHPLKDEAFTVKKIFNETLHVATIKDDPLSSKTSISFEELDGTNILVTSDTGYWDILCKRKLPNSLLLVQRDPLAYKTLLEVSTLAAFRTNLTIPRFRPYENRTYIPIRNPEATLSFYIVYPKEKDDVFSFIANSIKDIHWEQYRKDNF